MQRGTFSGLSLGQIQLNDGGHTPAWFAGREEVTIIRQAAREPQKPSAPQQERGKGNRNWNNSVKTNVTVDRKRRMAGAKKGTLNPRGQSTDKIRVQLGKAAAGL